MGITASGIGSGLDINGLVKQLVTAESRPMVALQAQQKTEQARLSAYGQLNAALATFQSAVNTLKAGALTAASATVSGIGLSASASSAATPANYAVSVTALAQANKLCSPGYASPTASLGSGSLSVAVAGGAPVVITPAGNSLTEICDAINAANAGVTASLISDGSANGHRLVISANQSGAANTIKLIASGDLAAWSFDPAAPVNFSYDAQNNPPLVMSQTQPAQDAALSVDGVKISATSNTVSNAISGVTLKLTQLSATPCRVAIERDSSSTTGAIANVVKAYNDFKNLAGTLTAWGETGKAGGTLKGDTAPAAMVAQLRSGLNRVTSGAAPFDTLSDIGLSFLKDGTLSVAQSKLQSAMDTEPVAFAALFQGADGVATRLASTMDTMLGDSGTISIRSVGLNARLRSLGQRSDMLQSRLDAIEQRYRKQFTALDAALSRMQSTSSFLSGQLAALSKNSA